MNIPKQVIENFNLVSNEYSIHQHGNGLIHQTYVVVKKDSPIFILQKVNHHVFKKPEDIAFNLNYIGDFINEHHPEYPFAKPLQTIHGYDYARVDECYFRLLPFIKGSHTVDVCNTEDQAYTAARAFGKFTSLLSKLDIQQLRSTIPGFHDLIHRYQQFDQALKTGNTKRLASSTNIAQFLIERKNIVDMFSAISQSRSFTLRVTHHDTKINNVLFDQYDNDLSVIDLDTVMPGYFISDIGDMMRTYLSPSNEEESDLEKVIVRKNFIQAIIEGYSSAMGDELDQLEKQAFLYGGKCIIYMQALRFYTDYLNNDYYYGARYENHNLIRAKNQIKLLSELESLENEFPKLLL